MSSTIGNSVRAFVVDAFYAPADLCDDASLLDTGTMDSTGVLELIAFLEKRWSIAVGDREIHPDNLDSIVKITAFVERKLAERGGVASPRPRDAAPASAPTPASLEGHP
jgi:acyl carrier protein